MRGAWGPGSTIACAPDPSRPPSEAPDRPPTAPGAPGLSVQITCQNPADISLVTNIRGPDVSSLAPPEGAFTTVPLENGNDLRGPTPSGLGRSPGDGAAAKPGLDVRSHVARLLCCQTALRARVGLNARRPDHTSASAEPLANRCRCRSRILRSTLRRLRAGRPKDRRGLGQAGGRYHCLRPGCADL